MLCGCFEVEVSTQQRVKRPKSNRQERYDLVAEGVVGMLCYVVEEKRRRGREVIEINFHFRSGHLCRRANTLPKRKSSSNLSQ